jgi:hypothetical protein
MKGSKGPNLVGKPQIASRPLAVEAIYLPLAFTFPILLFAVICEPGDPVRGRVVFWRAWIGLGSLSASEKFAAILAVWEVCQVPGWWCSGWRF